MTALGGWEHVALSDPTRPPARVGATLSCIEVPLQAKGLTKEEQEAAVLLDPMVVQYGLFLFGGDDDQDRQTDLLHVYYLQARKWIKPSVTGRLPAKRSRHTANVFSDPGSGKPRLLIFGGVNASNSVSVLDPHAFDWTHPAPRAAPLKKKKRRERDDDDEAEPMLPPARFGHSALLFERRLFIFGGRDHKGPLKDLFELELESETMQWQRPEPAGLPPPASSKHSAALARGHMLLISGEFGWEGHLWALQLRPPLTWFRSALPDFPLAGMSRFALVEYVTPRPHRREEVMIFGGVLEAPNSESQVVDAQRGSTRRAEAAGSVWCPVGRRSHRAWIPRVPGDGCLLHP